MLGHIYTITNIINGKIYVGQTTMPVHARWNKHISRSRQPNPTGIAGAIKKYGVENFIFEAICSAPVEELNDLEKYYIIKYDSFNSGYNLTWGGEGTNTLNLNEKEVINKYKELKTITETAKFFNCDVRAISYILHQNNVKISRNPNLTGSVFTEKNEHSFKEGDGIKPVRILETGQIFPSLKECSQWLIDNNYSKASSMELARKSLSRCLTGERKTYCKLHFEYA